jgi:hypothetical protein
MTDYSIDHPWPPGRISADVQGRLNNATVIAWFLALAVIAVAPVTTTIYSDAYPADLQKQRALDQCAARNRYFSRFFAVDRKACYRSVLGIPPSDEPQHEMPLHALATANFVDLWQAAGRGHLPANDIRMQVQSGVTAALRHTGQ